MDSHFDGTYDVIIIGAGVIGCCIARELSRYDIRVLVLEKECDVAYGISGRMSGVVHAGFNNKTGSLMARLCVEGNRIFENRCKELGIPYKKTGKILVAFDQEDMNALKRILDRGKANGCEDLKLIGEKELDAFATEIRGIGGMLSPNTAIFNPFEYCIAHAENALVNGVEFSFDSEVKAIRRNEGFFSVETVKGECKSRYLVNASGLWCDAISRMLGIDEYRIYPCRGQYFILDRIADELLRIPIYPVPKPGIGGLGVHLTPTIEGNIIIGPSAEYLDDREDYSTTSEIMEKLLHEAKEILPSIQKKYLIGNFCGIRPKLAPPVEGGFRDFVIKEETAYPGFINLIGIESPGFTASIPIAKMVCEMLSQHIELKEKKDFNPTREERIRFRELPRERQEKLILEDSEYGEIICRCQSVTKREIRDAIENSFGARSISSIKYRAWATTGRCNGGYCLTKIVDMLIQDYHMKPEEITYRSSGSEMFSGEVK